MALSKQATAGLVKALQWYAQDHPAGLAGTGLAAAGAGAAFSGHRKLGALLTALGLSGLGYDALPSLAMAAGLSGVWRSVIAQESPGSKTPGSPLTDALLYYLQKHPAGVAGAGLVAAGVGAELARRKRIGAVLSALGLGGLGAEAVMEIGRNAY